jgi:hypothetical protein
VGKGGCLQGVTTLVLICHHIKRLKRNCCLTLCAGNKGGAGKGAASKRGRAKKGWLVSDDEEEDSWLVDELGDSQVWWQQIAFKWTAPFFAMRAGMRTRSALTLSENKR